MLKLTLCNYNNNLLSKCWASGQTCSTMYVFDYHSNRSVFFFPSFTNMTNTSLLAELDLLAS